MTRDQGRPLLPRWFQIKICGGRNDIFPALLLVPRVVSCHPALINHQWHLQVRLHSEPTPSASFPSHCSSHHWQEETIFGTHQPLPGTSKRTRANPIRRPSSFATHKDTCQRRHPHFRRSNNPTDRLAFLETIVAAETAVGCHHPRLVLVPRPFTPLDSVWPSTVDGYHRQ